MKLYARITRAIALAGVAGFSLFAIAQASGLRLNTTKSIPLGLYRTVDEPVTVGSYVMFCPPNKEPFLEAKRRGYLTTGFCAGGFGYMMKKVLAAKKDVVRFDQVGVFVNTNLLALSKPLNEDGAGRPMPFVEPSEFSLKENELLLMSDVSATSFDGRYFGPVNKSQIKTVIKPIFLW